ncbi:hypothetical protein C5167_032771 [Papaver somniferum]|uniref:BHLH domain-containing protein n=1 Tax=Papaver somniferum TaxID=3469 RepID=A0A4Y7KC80_PAPSO|nr:transcription factor bHLH157-like isoform X1 [Papaver somniferum]RZC69638.1 hypothetical protein C5167_032771 [Papaver somniferum]
MNSRIKETLKCLCCNNGWSYGVFWRVNRQNPMVLTIEDAYSEEQTGIVIEKMLQQVHMLGEGIIGHAAFTGKHQWMFASTYCGEWGPTLFIDNQDGFQDLSQFHQQFSSGIETIALISVAPQGVVQFGSTRKIMESLEFFDQVTNLFRHPENVEGDLVSRNAPSINDETYIPSRGVDSVLSSETAFSNYWNVNAMPDDLNSKKLMGKTPVMVPVNAFSFAGYQMNNMNPIMNKSSLNPETQFQNGEAGQAIYPTMSTWASSLTSREKQVIPEIRKQESSNAFSGNLNRITGISTFQDFQGDAVTQFNMHIGQSQGDNFQQSFTAIHPNIQLVKESTSFNAYQGENAANDLSQYFVESQVHSSRSVTPTDEKSRALAITSSGSVFGDYFSGIHTTKTTMQNPTSDTISSLGLVPDGKENSLTITQQFSSDNDLYNSLGLTFSQNDGTECWNDLITSGGSGSQSSLSNGTSDCVSELDVGSIPPEKRLCPEFGLQHILSSGSGTPTFIDIPSSEDHLSPTTIMSGGNASLYRSRTQMAAISSSSGTMDRFIADCEPQKISIYGNQKEAPIKSQVGAWIGDTYSIHSDCAVSTQPKRSEEPVRVKKKRARPGESTRPRPKDRQQIQDRVKELREIVPHGIKCSIDGLLDRTIKYMVFLQSVTKYADKLKEACVPKIIGAESGVILKDNSTGEGATWAFEVNGKTMVCPITVGDLRPPSQMLVEMLCDEGDFFLEIADIIRGFGLTILKGIMEVQEDKIWARFIVEANRNVTRMDIFLSLVQFLQQLATGGINFSSQPSMVGETTVPYSNYQQSHVPLTIGLADRLL